MNEEVKAQSFPYTRINSSDKAPWKQAAQYLLYKPSLKSKPGFDICIGKDTATGKSTCIRAYSRKGCVKEINEEMARAKESVQYDFFMQYLEVSIATTSNMYFPTEFCNCGSLSDCIEQGKSFPLEIIREIASFLSYALSVLKSSKRVHGSINPRHVLVHADDYDCIAYKLCGWCVPQSKPNPLDQPYMAPELNDTKAITIETDIWATGVLLYQLATGKLPQEVASTFPSENNALPFEGVCDELEDLIKQCLKYNPEERITPNNILVHPFLFDESALETDFVHYLNTKLDLQNTNPIERRTSIVPYKLISIIEETRMFTLLKWKADGKTYLTKAVNLSGITRKKADEFISEIELLVEFQASEFILNIHDCFVCEQYLFIVMEWENMITLKEFFEKRIEQGKTKHINSLDGNSIAWGVACALREIHIKGMVYRNLHSRYIAIQKSPVTGLISSVKLFNFWNCKAASINDFSCRSHSIPPERVFTAAGDVWEYGLLLFKLLFGKCLYKYEDNSLIAVMKRQIYFPLIPQDDTELYTLILKCLDPEPVTRPTFAEIVSSAYFRILPKRVKRSIYPYAMISELLYNTEKATRKYKCTREGSTQTFELVAKTEKCLSDDERHKIMLMYRMGACPYIKTLYDYFWVGKTLYLIYDYFEGMSLEPYIYSNHSKLSTKEILECAASCAKALRHLHRRNIVYRCMRPESICVLAQNQPGISLKDIKLVGFKYAKALFSGETGKSLIIDVTTAVNFAPELSTEGVYSKADIWSYGLLLYFLLFGMHPLNYKKDGVQVNNYKDMYSYGVFRHPNTMHGVEVVEIMKRCLRVLPEERPTAEQILAHPVFTKIQ